MTAATPDRHFRGHPPSPEVAAIEQRKLLPIPDAAHRLGIGRTLMYELIAAGVIPTVRIGNKRRLVPVEALDAYADNLERENTTSHS
jgi:excisionase family DNA binding protein